MNEFILPLPAPNLDRPFQPGVTDPIWPLQPRPCHTRTREDLVTIMTSEHTYWLRFSHRSGVYPYALYWAFELMVWGALWEQEDARK